MREAAVTSGTGGPATWLRDLCRVAVRDLPALGVGVSVMSGPRAAGLTACSDARSEAVEELQFTLGEGPCLDAFASGTPVLAPDLGHRPARWPAYSPAAEGLGVHAVFAFPMLIGTARLGVLDVYRAEVGELSEAAEAQALGFAEQARDGLLAGRTDDGFGHRVVVYQAQGMVQVQLGVSSEEALVRLRAFAYAHDRRLSEVAQDIVSRRLTLERDER